MAVLKYYAHSCEINGSYAWHPLNDHLKDVALLAREFAESFGGGMWAETTGFYHDLGKAAPGWQAYLRRGKIEDEFASAYEGHPNHADIGAQYVFKYSKDAGQIVAYLIAGHHGGLPDWIGETSGSGLKVRLCGECADVPLVEAAPDVPVKPVFPTNLPFTVEKRRFGYQMQFFIRMLFSCLVDADYLDTERFMDATRANGREAFLPLAGLQDVFWAAYNRMRDESDSGLAITQQREGVLKNCLDSAQQKPGLFSLTVPTGGGKTLTSLAFALEHARRYGKKRIIYVIPFTSIIEQNAKVFREFLGDKAVLEHHCNFVHDDSQGSEKLATENWAAPIIVTTNVQFFDSFYANRTSRCRKLHNIAQSVVIFDEVQAIPVEKLKPCLEVIRELSKNYGVTSVLCTATQPAVQYGEHFPDGLHDVREIIPDVPALFDRLRRTEEKFIGELEVQALADRLTEYKQVLCIVNTRQQALDVFHALPNSDDNFHLSALMYPLHRSAVLEEIVERLKKDAPCRVISTQLVEAGVDVDFPCVYRAVAGIDSIAQAAGRCNRNGKNSVPQPVYVFQFPKKLRISFFRQAAQSAEKLFEKYKGCLTSPECVKEFFRDYFWKNDERMDGDDILGKCKKAKSGNIPFKEIAQFQMINSTTIPIVIALDDNSKLLNKLKELEYIKHRGSIFRYLQQYTVQIYPYQYEEIKEWLISPIEGIFVLKEKNKKRNLYLEHTGLRSRAPEGEGFYT